MVSALFNLKEFVVQFDRSRYALQPHAPLLSAIYRQPFNGTTIAEFATPTPEDHEKNSTVNSYPFVVVDSCPVYGCRSRSAFAAWQERELAKIRL
jgi:hypothetical protein